MTKLNHVLKRTIKNHTEVYRKIYLLGVEGFNKFQIQSF